MYNVNIRKFAKGLLPFAMRGNVASLLDVLTQPFRVLHFKLADFRSKCTWKLSYNACVGSMQAMLNNRFADVLALRASGHQILVEDGASVSDLLIYPDDEQQPVVVGCVAVMSHTTWGAQPFNVKIPNELYNNHNLEVSVERMVQLHKFAGTKYNITYYTAQ